MSINKMKWGNRDMAENSSSQNVDPHLVAEIVRGYVANNSIALDQLGGLIETVHQTLSGLSTNTTAPALVPEKLAPAVPIRRSVQPDYVVCLECGFRAVTLRRHLRVAHGLEPAAYRVRWKLATDHALTAPVYSERRSTMANNLGSARSGPRPKHLRGRAAAGEGRRLQSRPRPGCQGSQGDLFKIAR
jgi:predicted transcriptional regulator